MIKFALSHILLILLINNYHIGLKSGIYAAQLSDPLPANNASDDEFRIYLALCSNTDPNLVSQEVLDNYRLAVQHINNGGIKPKVCWIAPGEAGDLGWSYQEYNAVNVINFCLGVETTIKSSVTFEQSFKVMEDLIVVENCGVLFPISFEFQFAISALAPLYPDTMFVAPVPIPETGVLENVRTFAINGYEATYLMGYLSQLMDTTYDIGGVTSLHIVTEFQGAFTYWAGIQDAASEEGVEPKIWHLWFTDSFSDVDKALFATQDLVERFGVNHVSQTVDPYEPQVWLRENEFTGTGVIADMGLFSGRNTIGSQMVRWDIAGLNTYSMLLANGGSSWGNTPIFVPCNAWTGSITFGTLSSLVPDDIKAKVFQKYAFLQSSPFATFSLWCGDRVLPLLQPGQSLDQNGCMNFDQIFNISVVHPGIDYLGTYEIELTEIKISDGVKITEGVLSGISILFAFICIIVFYIKRNTHIVKTSSLIMTNLNLLGCIISIIGAILYIPDPTDSTCNASVAIYTAGFYITLGSFVAKIYGFVLIKTATNKLQRVTVDLKKIIWVMIVIMIIGMTFVIWWSVDSSGREKLTSDDTTELSKYEFRYVCEISGDDIIILSLMLAYGLLIVLLVLIIHYILSSNWIPAAKLDSQRMAIVSWMIIVTASIALGISLALENNQDTLEIVLFFCSWLAISSVIMFYHFPKVIMIARYGDLDSSKVLSVKSTLRSSTHTSSDVQMSTISSTSNNNSGNNDNSTPENNLIDP